MSNANLARETNIDITSVRIHPVNARRTFRTEQAAGAGVIPAAVFSMVFCKTKKKLLIYILSINVNTCVVW